MAALDRVFNIAQTGRIDEPTPVDNIMAQYKPREQAQGGLWNGVKNFAGSNGGRMLLGGLAGAALGGLTGRNINEALTGGIMGATGAANGITRRNQYNDMIAHQQQERADRLRELENGRNFQREMQQNNLAAQKEAADLAFERRLQELDADREFRRKLAAEDRLNAIADRQSDYDFRTKLANDQHERTLEALGLKNDFAREGWKYQADREDARYERGLRDEIAREERAENRYQNHLNDTRDYEARLLEDKIRRENDLWERNQQAALDKEERDARRYDARLSDTRDYENQVRADERAYKQDLLDEQRKYDADLLKEKRAYNSGLLADERAYDQQKDLNKLEYKRKEAEQKAELESKEAERQNEIMRPRLEQSISRARSALKDGTGLGQFGGWGWTTGQGGQNRADVMTAQAQINTMMRGLLKQMGVGSTELNSAAEAAAYRYQISPDMPIEQISRVLDDFERDYMNGTLQKEAAVVAGQYGANSGSGNFTIERID